MSSVRKIRCKSCQSVFKIRISSDEKKRIRCPQCEETMVVGGSSAPKPKRRPAAYEDDDYGQDYNPLPTRSRSGGSSSKKKKKKKSGNNNVLIGVLGGAVGLLLIVSIVLGVMFLGKDDNAPVKEKEQVASNTNNNKIENNTANNTKPEKKKPEGKKKPVLDASWVKSTTAPVDMFSSSAKVSLAPPSVVYKWSRGKSFSYEVSFKAELEGEKLLHKGITNLLVVGENTSGSLGGLERVEGGGKGSGTGFVVSPDGYIVTCRHVIEGASKIEARVDGKMYPAKVLAIHKTEDLAILQVKAKNLPYVPLADSDKVNLGQAVRVIGYPVASILGSTVKYTQGNIAGIAEKMKRFQLDCVVNPGNSGGPAFNNKGEVIGVTDSKLVQRAVSQVCFAIPTEPVEEFLKSHNVPYQKTESTKTIEPEDLVKKVTPAVVYIEVTSQPEKKGKSFEIQYFTTLITESAKLRTRSGLVIPIPKVKTEQGKMLVSKLGQVYDYRGRESFPFMFDRFGTLMLEELPKHDMNDWGSQEVVLIDGLPCMVSSSYKFKSSTSEKMTINKEYILRSTDNAENPAYKISGSGDLIIDKLKGVPESYHFKGEVALLLKGGTVRLRIPLNVDYRLRSQAEVIASKKKYDKQKKAAEEAAKRLAAPPTKAERATLLADLKSRKPARMQRALKVLRTKVPLKPDKDISRAILLLVNYKKDYLVKSYARSAIKHWVAPESVKSIITMLRRSDSKKDITLRLVLIEGLGVSQSESAVKYLITILQAPSSSDKYRATESLKKLGSIAEPHVVRLLSSTYFEIKLSACEILITIGTKKSLPALENTKNSTSTSLSYRAKRAIDAINKRG